MKAVIKRIGGNEFEVRGNGVTVLVSYETPVAVLNAFGRVSRSKTRFSRSTEQHIRDFQAGRDQGGDWLQENLDRLLFELIGDTRLRGKAQAGGRVKKTEGIDYDAHTEPGDAHLVVPVTRRRAAQAS